jgi:ATP-dependent 26S proteasome regulatory subunit
LISGCHLQEYTVKWNRHIDTYLPCVCPGADIRSVCTEAGMYAIRARRKTVTEKDFLEAVNKVIKGYQKFSATPKYMVYN